MSAFLKTVSTRPNSLDKPSKRKVSNLILHSHLSYHVPLSLTTQLLTRLIATISLCRGHGDSTRDIMGHCKDSTRRRLPRNMEKTRYLSGAEATISHPHLSTSTMKDTHVSTKDMLVYPTAPSPKLNLLSLQSIESFLTGMIPSAPQSRKAKR